MSKVSREQDWKSFVTAYGWRVKAIDLAYIVGVPVQDILNFRARVSCVPTNRVIPYVELFALWRGRAPSDDEWPAPSKSGNGGYEWQAREVKLLVSMTGSVGTKQIASILTKRLRAITGDPLAERNVQAVNLVRNRSGLVSSDVVGGLTVAEASREIGNRTAVQQAIDNNQLQTRRVGRLLVISRISWEEWKRRREATPKGYVQLSTYRERLGIKSDKLSEFARLGYVPNAQQIKEPGGIDGKFGNWWVPRSVAEQMLADRRAGRPMPWAGKPLLSNLKASYSLWLERRHPAACPECRRIWGAGGAPKSFDDYVVSYPALSHPDKKHLTRPWSPGMRISEAAEISGVGVSRVSRAIGNGALSAIVITGRKYVEEADVKKWMARGCPTGDRARDWISYGDAEKFYHFSRAELKVAVKSGLIISKKAAGRVLLARRQCAELRRHTGFSEAAAAERLGMSLTSLRKALRSYKVPPGGVISFTVFQNIAQRRSRPPGQTIGRVASQLHVSINWIMDQIEAGIVRPIEPIWDSDELYFTKTMVGRLKSAAKSGGRSRAKDQPVPSADWLRLGQAGFEAGVSVTTIMKWAREGDLSLRMSAKGCLYGKESVREKARKFWSASRLKRANPPAWLSANQVLGVRTTGGHR